MEARPNAYMYHTAVKWVEQRQGVISCTGKPDVQVVTPPEFKGHEGIWSPEELIQREVPACKGGGIYNLELRTAPPSLLDSLAGLPCHDILSLSQPALLMSVSAAIADG